MADTSVIASMIRVAGAGFRLSLVLNAVGMEMGTAHLEVQAIARDISLFSLMLKQVGRTMETPGSIASQGALDTAREIAGQSETVFSEIKEMVEMSQKQDERGNIQSITIAQKVRWCFKKHKMQYLLGQLESLKLSLTIMLQVLQLGKIIAAARYHPSIHDPTEQDMLQERAEVQNMVLVRHWSLVNLRRLFQLAEDEGAHPADSPPPSYREMAELDGDPRLSIAASEHRETSSSAMVKYQETPLSQLDASMNNAMLRPNRILHAPDNTVVDHLLDEWTRLREMKAQHQRRRHKYDPHYETDTETDSQSEFERSENIGGRYIEGPKRKPKNVHFRSRVESGSEHSDHTKPSRKPPSRHVLRSNNSSTSSLTSSSSSDDNIAPLPSSRRSSASSTASRKPDQNASTQRYTPPSPNSNGDGTQPVRPSSRGGPPPPPPPFLQSWQGQPPYPGVHPHPQPQQYINPAPPPPPPPGPRRAHSTLPYTPSYPPPGMQARAPYNPPLNPNLNPNLMHPHPHHHHHPHRGSTQQRRPSRTSRPPRERRAEKKESSFKENAKKDVKRGLLGAGAVAGLMDILEGLSGI